MSIVSFLAKIWLSIKRMFSKLPADLKFAIQIGVVITENLKKVVDWPGTSLITAIIPGELDNYVHAKLQHHLPLILVKLKLAEAGTSTEDIYKAAIRAIVELQPEVRPGVLHQLSILVAQLLADGKLSWSDGVFLLEWYYKNNYKPANE